MTNILYSLFSEVPKNDCEKGSRKPKFDFLGPKIVKGIGQPPGKINAHFLHWFTVFDNAHIRVSEFTIFLNIQHSISSLVTKA